MAVGFKSGYWAALICVVFVFALLPQAEAKVAGAISPVEADILINTNELVVLHLVENWCDACVRFEPNLTRIQARVQRRYPKVMFNKIDLDGNVDAWRFFQAKGLPHFVLTSRGVPIPYEGELSEKLLERWLIRSIKKKPTPLQPTSRFV